MNIKPRTAIIAIGAVIGLIILGQVTKTDPPKLTPADIEANDAATKKRVFNQWCADHVDMCKEATSNIEEARKRALQ
jgi:hypothetical protein